MVFKFLFGGEAPAVSVLMVCTANICRSPLAHGLLAHRVDLRGLGKDIFVDSAGTQVGMKGQRPDARAQAVAKAADFDISGLKTRKLETRDFERFDYLMAMDAEHLQTLEAMCPSGQQHKLGMIMDFATGDKGTEIPDPYFGNEAGFERVLELLDDASQGLLQHILQTHFPE